MARLRLLIMFLFITNSSNAQLIVSDELSALLIGKKNFTEVMTIVNQYYVSKNFQQDSNLIREFKFWNRWAWYEARHLDSAGNFVNSNQRIFDVITELQNSNVMGPTTQSPESNNGNWASFGPTNIAGGIGRVDRLAFDPIDANTMYAGTTAGGLWKTTNGGTDWSTLTGYVPSLGVSGIVVDVNNPNIIYVLSGDGDSFINGGMIYTRSSIGILKSINGGSTWTNIPLPSSSSPYYGFKLIQLPDYPNILFACTSNGLFRSSNSGATWVKNADIGTQNVFDIEISPSSPNILYATIANAIYKSTNWGAAFTIIPVGAYTPPIPGGSEISIAVSPDSPNGLYANITGFDDLYFSADNGTSFNRVNASSPTTSTYTNAMTVSPLDINTVIIGNINLMRSTNGGTSFPTTGANLHADIHDLQYNPINNVLFAGCDGGVYKSIDNGANWTALLNGMNATQYYHMGCFTGIDGLLLAGAQDNGMQLRNGSNTFTSVGGGDGFDGKFLNGNSNLGFFSINAGVFQYTVNTNSNTLVLNPSGNINNQTWFYPHLAIHPTNDNIIYAGYGLGVFRSLTNGNVGTWVNVGSSGSAGFGAAGGLTVSANNPDRIYAANGSSLQVSDNRGTNWTTISGNTGWQSGTITDIRTRPSNADEIWVTFGGFGAVKVLYSVNAGTTWTDMTGSLPNVPVYSIEYTTNGDAYIGTDVGVFYMSFLMTDWIPFSNNLPLLPVTEVYADATSNSLKAATFGRGIWRSDLYSTCAASLNLSGAAPGIRFYQASGTISSTQSIAGSYGNEMRMRSPTSIVFNPGFVAEAGSYLNAIIANCGQGIMATPVGIQKAIPKDLLTKKPINRLLQKE